MGNRHTIKTWLGITWVWWVIITALLAWTVWTLWPKPTSLVEVPYSTFIDQVKASNVSKVQIQGGEIEGALIKPIAAPTTSKILLRLPSTTYIRYSSFRTLFPAEIGDPGLIPLLTAHDVEVSVSSPPSAWITVFSSSTLPLLLLVLTIGWMGGNVWRNRAGRLSSPRVVNRQRKTGITFADVAGAGSAKEQMKDVVAYLHHPEKYDRLTGRIPTGILLSGPPGTGKTLLARALSGEAGVPLLSISAIELTQASNSDGVGRMHELFKQARASVPDLVFIDKLEAIGRRSGTGRANNTPEAEHILSQLLFEMDRLGGQQATIVLAATSHIDLLDPILLQPGYFEQQVVLTLPDRLEREAILSLHTHKLHMAPDVDLHLVARTTTGFSGADLVRLCTEATTIKADRRGHSQVSMSDFEDALDRVLMSYKHSLLLNDSSRRVIAYHEAGHALVAWLTPAADSVQKVTIIQHEPVLGFTDQISSGDGYNVSHEYLLARLSVMLGGRAAEEIAIGDLTAGAERDLVEATRLARRMVARWGMGSLGPVALDTSSKQSAIGPELTPVHEYSEEIAARIDQDLLQLLRDRYQAVRGLLEREQQKLDRLVEVLMQDETIDMDNLTKILGARPSPGEGENSPGVGKT